jgi:DNA gyrase/topoisomerase IV subunit A
VIDETIKPVECPISFEGLTALAENMIAGVSMCIKRIKGDDIFKHRLESIPNEINQLIADMGTLLDFQANEYNALVDQCEELQSSYGLLRLRNTELEKELNISADATAKIIEREREIHLRERKELEDKITELSQGSDSLFPLLNCS